MRVGLGTRRLIVALICALAPMGAGAAPIRYAWSGFVEPGNGANPWGVAGDGSAVTPTDGTPYTLEVLVDEAAIDQDGAMNPGLARFVPDAITLIIGGNLAGLSDIAFSFGDDDASFQFDNIQLTATVELLGVSQTFGAEVRIAPATFSLADPAALDLPPIFADTTPIQFGAFVRDVRTVPADATVSATLIPEPASAALLAAGLCALAGRRRALGKRS